MDCRSSQRHVLPTPWFGTTPKKRSSAAQNVSKQSRLHQAVYHYLQTAGGSAKSCTTKFTWRFSLLVHLQQQLGCWLFPLNCFPTKMSPQRVSRLFLSAAKRAVPCQRKWTTFWSSYLAKYTVCPKNQRLGPLALRLATAGFAA